MSRDPGNSPPEEWTEEMPESDVAELRQLLTDEFGGGDDDGGSSSGDQG